MDRCRKSRHGDGPSALLQAGDATHGDRAGIAALLLDAATQACSADAYNEATGPVHGAERLAIVDAALANRLDGMPPRTQRETRYAKAAQVLARLARLDARDALVHFELAAVLEQACVLPALGI